MARGRTPTWTRCACVMIACFLTSLPGSGCSLMMEDGDEHGYITCDLPTDPGDDRRYDPADDQPSDTPQEEDGEDLSEPCSDPSSWTITAEELSMKFPVMLIGLDLEVPDEHVSARELAITSERQGEARPSASSSSHHEIRYEWVEDAGVQGTLDWDRIHVQWLVGCSDAAGGGELLLEKSFLMCAYCSEMWLSTDPEACALPEEPPTSCDR